MALSESHADSVTVDFDLVPEDIRSFVRYTMLEAPSARRKLLRTGVFTWSCLVLLAGVRAASHGGDAGLLGFVVLAALAAAPFTWLIVWLSSLLRVAISSERQVLTTKGLGRWSFTADAAGLHHVHRNGSASLRWSDLDRVETSRTGLYVFTSQTNAHVIPLSAFADSRDMEAFLGYIESHIQA